MTKITFFTFALTLGSQALWGQTSLTSTRIAQAPAKQERVFEQMTLTYRVAQAGDVWFFDVFGDGNLLFSQAEVLQAADKRALVTQALAEKAAMLAIAKVKAGIAVPSISQAELLSTKQN